MRVRTCRNLLAALAGAAALTACSLNTDYFSDYRGANLISNYPFTSTSWKLTDDTTSNPTPADYMNWATAAATGPDGSSAYRLEIKNLIPNGDFEDTSVTYPTTAWNAVTIAQLTTDSAVMDNHSLSMAGGATSDTFTLNISAALSSQSLLRTGKYRIQMNFKKPSISVSNFILTKTVDGNSTQSTLELSDNHLDTSTIYSMGTTTYMTNGPVTFLSLTLTNTSTATLQFGDGNTSTPNFKLDDLTMVRGDIYLSTQLSLPSINSGSKTFLPGSGSTAYTFSLYVLDDSTASETSGSHVLNRINPSGLTVQITGGVKSGAISTYKKFFSRPSAGWTSWTKLTMSFGLDFVDSDSQLTGPALLIQLTPTNDLDFTTGGRNSGSLLVASPSFIYNP